MVLYMNQYLLVLIKTPKKNLIILLNKSVDNNFNLNFKTYISKILNSFYNNLIESKLN